ncbi:MAG: hypothetical protein AAFY38_05375 [Pseudomonadota bacterium]
MQANHPGALDNMRRDRFSKEAGVDEWFEFDMLNDACADPTRFPVHVLADDTVVDIIKSVRRTDRMMFWADIGAILLRMVRGRT